MNTIMQWAEKAYNMFIRAEKLLYGGLVLLLLWPVWANKYFLTLDGPCHLYNSTVLLNFWQGKHVSFFSQFYTLNPHIDPNWFSHLALAGLMYFLPPVLSEKILVSLYLLCFLFFSRLLITQLNPQNKLLAFLPFLFVYHHVFQMGFYNFSYSLAFMVFAWWFFFRYSGRISTFLFVPVLSLILLITYLAHPIGYLLACGSIGLVLIMGALAQKEKQWAVLGRQLIAVFIAALPSFILILYFIMRRVSYSVQPGDRTFSELGNSIIHLTSITNLVSAESPYTTTIFWFMVALTVIALGYKIKSRRITGFDAFFIVVIALVVFYFNCPNAIGGAGIVPERLQIIPFVILPFWLATANFSKPLQVIIAAGAIILTCCLAIVRIPVYRLTSGAIEEFMSVQQYIKPESTVLPLSYAHNGKTEDGKPIADKIWLFFHSADYLGATKPLIMLGNYEANTGYFPLLWKREEDPFVHLCDNDGIEAIPPSVVIPEYERATGKKVDYVIPLCLDGEFRNHPNTINLFQQLDSFYTLIYTSPHGRALLYHRKGETPAH
ncbi:MAG TPA: hypothetical protein VG603_04555 [Chitinophagales bacterium]|nr:hypothetical protein [Chitinophagales bacterium]